MFVAINYFHPSLTSKGKYKTKKLKLKNTIAYYESALKWSALSLDHKYSTMLEVRDSDKQTSLI